jgi:hypothetical protein
LKTFPFEAESRSDVFDNLGFRVLEVEEIGLALEVFDLLAG